MAISRIGRIYDEILKEKQKAKLCYMKMLQLLNGMPNNFMTECKIFITRVSDFYQSIWYNFCHWRVLVL